MLPGINDSNQRVGSENNLEVMGSREVYTNAQYIIRGNKQKEKKKKKGKLKQREIGSEKREGCYFRALDSEGEKLPA